MAIKNAENTVIAAWSSGGGWADPADYYVMWGDGRTEKIPKATYKTKYRDDPEIVHPNTAAMGGTVQKDAMITKYERKHPEAVIPSMPTEPPKAKFTHEGELYFLLENGSLVNAKSETEWRDSKVLDLGSVTVDPSLSTLLRDNAAYAYRIKTAPPASPPLPPPSNVQPQPTPIPRGVFGSSPPRLDWSKTNLASNVQLTPAAPPVAAPAPPPEMHYTSKAINVLAQAAGSISAEGGSPTWGDVLKRAQEMGLAKNVSLPPGLNLSQRVSRDALSLFANAAGGLAGEGGNRTQGDLLTRFGETVTAWAKKASERTAAIPPPPPAVAAPAPPPPEPPFEIGTTFGAEQPSVGETKVPTNLPDLGTSAVGVAGQVAPPATTVGPRAEEAFEAVSPLAESIVNQWLAGFSAPEGQKPWQIGSDVFNRAAERVSQRARAGAAARGMLGSSAGLREENEALANLSGAFAEREYQNMLAYLQGAPGGIGAGYAPLGGLTGQLGAGLGLGQGLQNLAISGMQGILGGDIGINQAYDPFLRGYLQYLTGGR